MTNVPESLYESMQQDADGDKAEGVQKVMGSELQAAGVPMKVNTELASLAPSLLRPMSLGSASFGDQAVGLVSSPEFLKSFSDDLGVPQPGESRDAFIARGKDVLRDNLRKALKA